ncbi:hypothetical protein ACFWM5_37130, partial [Streptomyces bobili]|uniref:hypothetical protein n=1 Tax=Streptomyces bobili TaxID=67280 RepID=UPI003648B185
GPAFMPAAGGNHPIETPVRRTPLKIGTTTATKRRDKRPRTLGSWSIEYQRFSSLLSAVGGVEITYRRWSSLPRTVGQWSCEHSRSGAQLLRIGPHDLRYDPHGGNVCGVGPLEIFYGEHGSSPIRSQLPGRGDSLSDELLLMLFLTLFWQEQTREAREAYYQARR